MKSPARTASPARRPLSRERILTTAVALADEQGIDVLSMRNLGRALGCEAMSLYNHVASKDDLLDGIVDRVVAEIEVPVVGRPWKDEMRRRARSAHEVLRRHPWACALLMSRANLGPSMLRYVDATIGCLRAAGFSLDLVDRAWNALDSFVYGFTLQTLNFPFAPDEYASAAAEHLPRIDASTHPHLHEMTRAVSEAAHDGVADFGFGLELLLDGLERRHLAARSGGERE